jgi:hypothetical protein
MSATQPNQRYFVPDLSPQDRDILKSLKPKWVFVAESPHVSEVEPESLRDRRPLCGMAGKKWWGLLSEILEGESNSDVGLDRLLKFCAKQKIAVMNAVQYPLDPKVGAKFPGADPAKNLGFNKVSGLYSYKKLKKSKVVQKAIQELSERLSHPSVAHLPVYSLGNDAEWFVQQALEILEDQDRYAGKIYHPSAWWRKGGYFGRVAKEKLQAILPNN